MTRWTEEQLAAFHARKRNDPTGSQVNTSTPPFMLPGNEAGAFALGRLPRGTMNKTETAYAAHLADLQATRQILWFRFEAIKLRLADNTFFTPDFLVLPASGLLEVREVKGHWEDDARVKIKVAASIFPFRFLAVTKRPARDGGGWEVEEFS